MNNPCGAGRDVTPFCRFEDGELLHDDQRKLKTDLVAMVRPSYTLRKVRVRVVGDAMTERDAFIIIK